MGVIGRVGLNPGYRGTLLTPAHLPATGNPGDFYQIQDDGDGRTSVYAWNPTANVWEKQADPDGTGGGGVTDHGLMTGLEDFDHPQYVRSPPAALKAAWGGDDFLSQGYRPYATPATVATDLYVDAVGGNDSNDGLTEGTALATTERAVQMVPISHGEAVSIHLGAGTYLMPATLSIANWCHFYGTKTLLETRTVTSPVPSEDNENGIKIVVDGAPIVDDAWQGDLIRISNGPGSSIQRGFGYVVSNVGNELYVTQYGDTIQSMVGQTVERYSHDTELIFDVPAPVAIASMQMEFTDCRIYDPTKVWFVSSTAKVAFRRCNFEIRRLSASNFGRIFLETCYLAMTGTAGQGVLSATNGGFVLLHQGTVIDCDRNIVDANDNRRFINVDNEGSLVFGNEVIVVGLNSSGFKIDGGGAFLENGLTDRTVVRLEDCDAAWTINSSVEGAGGRFQLPYTYGVLGVAQHAVTARKGAQVEYPIGSNVVPVGGVVNSVSSNNGDTAWAEHPDGTRILGGNPPPYGYRYAEIELGRGNVLADDGANWALASSWAADALYDVEALAPADVAGSPSAPIMVAGVTLGALARLAFVTPPPVSSIKFPAYLAEGYNGTSNSDKSIRFLRGAVADSPNPEHVACGQVHNFEYTDPFSISFWIRTLDGEQGVLVSHDRGATLGYRGYSVWMLADGNMRFNLVNDWDTHRLQVDSVDGQVLDGYWHSVVVTSDGSGTGAGVKIYVDDRETTTDVTGSISATMQDASAPFTFGGRPYASDTQPPTCILDEVAVWDAVIGEADATVDIYNGGTPQDLAIIPPGLTNLVGWWPIGYVGDSFPTLVDASGSGNDGTMTHMAESNLLPVHGLASHLAPIAPGHARVDLGKIQDADGDATSVLTRFDPEPRYIA